MRDAYLHRIQYYETDQMGIVHHSNYIRWFEEARDDFAARRGISYVDMEAQGVQMPVISVECRYKAAALYGNDVAIFVRPRFFNGARLAYEYEVRSPDGETLHALGRSEHCFIDAVSRMPLNAKRRLPEYSEIMLRLVAESNGGET